MKIGASSIIIGPKNKKFKNTFLLAFLFLFRKKRKHSKKPHSFRFFKFN